MRPYIRKVQYHETDKMGVAHHSNFIKWMEEARVDFLDQMGYGYAKLEKDTVEVSYFIGKEFQKNLALRGFLVYNKGSKKLKKQDACPRCLRCI